MKPTQDKYPFFEANQVLTNAHLNQAIDFLDEQERLTRANLIGIGIVCGLEISVDNTASTITVTKGCGISSEGYLIVQPDDIILGRYKDYPLPEEKNSGKYSAFLKADKSQYQLSELVEDNENNKASSNLITPSVLNDKAVLLFLELKKEGLRNCSPNNCDDKGAAITATVRYLLIAKNDLNDIIAKANELPTGQTVADLEAKLLAQLNLPDLRLPRYDVPNSNLATSKELLTAFHRVFSTDNLAAQLADALGKAYEAFKPIVQPLGNPSADFKAKFGFLDNLPTSTTQVKFLQYYYDGFDDLIKAYDEFRWKGLALLCACCPSEKLFPRHLMLGLVSGTSSSVYRNSFLASSASTNCDERTKEVVLLFHRLVEMIAHFTDTPPLSPLLKLKKAGITDTQIHITPSKLADVPLSDKAIPYYYQQSGELPLFELWNAEKSRHNRANQNLSYRSYQYQPKAPVFITDALHYDLEPYNFLRIEGHLGKHYQGVMTTLLTLKARYRLPIEVIALRSGVFDDTITVDLTKESNRFQDLEALYDVLREELLSNLCEGMIFLYDIVIDGAKLNGGTPKMPLLKTYAPNFRYKENTVGAWYEQYLTRIQAIPYIDVDQNAIDANTLLLVYCQLFNGTVAPDPKYYAHIVSIYYFSKLAEILPLSLSELGYANFENKYQDLLGLTRYFRGVVQVSEDLKQFIPQEELIDHFDQVLFSCKLQAVKATHDEYLRRLRELKQKQFLSDFLQKNPAIQHKAGVPLGGTFIIVYHENPPLVTAPINFTFNPALFKATAEPTLSAAFTRLQSKQDVMLNPDFQLIFSELTAQLPLLNTSVLDVIQSTAFDEIMDETISEFNDGTVIADFYLPYRFNADGQAIQFVLPKIPPTFTVKIGCANADGALVTVTPEGGLPPYFIKIDTAEYQLLGETLRLDSGEHTLKIRDSEDSESIQQTILVASPLMIVEQDFKCSEDASSYTSSLLISGGTPPYTVNKTVIDGNVYTTNPTASGTLALIDVVDNNQCTNAIEVSHSCKKPCDLPCAGIALRRGYYFSLPNVKDSRFQVNFSFESQKGEKIDLSEKVHGILQEVAGDSKSFVKQINALIAETTGSSDWLKFDYNQSEPGFMDTWWIEYFECLEFSFGFSYPLGVVVAVVPITTVTVTPTASTILVTQLEKILLKVTIPAFDSIKIDKCNPEIPAIPLCPKELNLKLEITQKLNFPVAFLDVKPSGDDQPVAYLWEVQGGNPAMSNDQQANFRFNQLEPNVKNIRLTAFTKDGCRLIQNDAIKFG
jgi:hypothetical protein